MPTLSDLIAEAPVGERSLLELRATWDSLPDAHARVAARLRVFVLNWDPLGWLGEPFAGSATATGDGDDYEVVLYAPLAAAAGLLDDLCRSVVDVGVSQELLLSSGAYAQLASAGKVPDLLSAIGTLSATEAPQLEPVRGGWEPIGLGAIQDLVQARFGPVDLDRSAVMLEAVAERQPACAACAGRRFGFPAELADELAAMCAPHARQAEELTSARLERANASSNPAPAIRKPPLARGLSCFWGASTPLSGAKPPLLRDIRRLRGRTRTSHPGGPPREPVPP